MVVEGVILNVCFILGYIVDEMIDLFICVRLINYCYF